jgi:hypothetical protein
MPRNIVEKGVAVTVDFHSILAPLGRKPRNRARTDIVSAREFGKRSAFRTWPPCLGLFGGGRSWGAAPCTVRAASPDATLGGAGTDKVARSTSKAAAVGSSDFCRIPRAADERSVVNIDGSAFRAGARPDPPFGRMP